MDICVFKQIQTQNNDIFKLYISSCEDNVKIVLFQNEIAWKSIIIKKRLEQFANEHKLTLRNYYENLQNYIKNDCSDIVFIVDDEEFIIKKQIKESLMIKYFTCKLIKLNYPEVIEESMQNLYSLTEKLQEQVQNLHKENTEIRKQKEQYKLKLMDLVDEKKAFESNQYSQFLLILNEKKRKIQHLTELLEAFKTGGLPVQTVGQLKRNRKKVEGKNAPVHKLETISDSASSESEEIPTSDEDNTSDQEKVKSQPSTSTGIFDLLNDEAPTDSMLPKRLKRSTTDKEDSASVLPEKSPSNVDAVNRTNDKSPTINFSTQDLLDMF